MKGEQEHSGGGGWLSLQGGYPTTQGEGSEKEGGMNVGGGAPKAFPVEVEAREEEGDTKV